MKKNLFNWSWFAMILFFGLSIWNFRFGLIALLCMIIPYIVLYKTGKNSFCTYQCPRGSLLVKFTAKISLHKKQPAIFRNKYFKTTILLIFLTIFSIFLFKSKGDVELLGFYLFRMIVTSTFVGIVLALIFKPKTWCEICPIGFTSKSIAPKISKN